MSSISFNVSKLSTPKSTDAANADFTKDAAKLKQDYASKAPQAQIDHDLAQASDDFAKANPGKNLKDFEGALDKAGLGGLADHDVANMAASIGADSKTSMSDVMKDFQDTVNVYNKTKGGYDSNGTAKNASTATKDVDQNLLEPQTTANAASGQTDSTPTNAALAG
jgi:hypothetical protein